MKPAIHKIETHIDERGFFKTVFSDAYVKDICISQSRAGTFRGLHLQQAPYAQAKYVHLLKGEIIDLVYDPFEREMQEFHLSENDNQILYIPKGYAHGFFAKSNVTLLYGICNNLYTPEYSKTYSVYDLPDVEFESKDYILKNIKYITTKDRHGTANS